MKKYFFSAVICIIILLSFLSFSMCDKGKKSPIIGVILAATGKADFIGKPEMDVLKKLREEYTKKGLDIYGIELKYRDSGGDPGQAITLFNNFAKDPRVIAIIGPSTSGESIPLAKRANIEKIPLLSLAASKKIVLLDDGTVNPWAFKFAQNDDLAANRLTRIMVRKGHKEVAFLFSNDGFGKSGAEVFKEASKNSNISIIHQSSFPSYIDSVEPYIRAIPKKIRGIVIWGTAPGPALLVKALKMEGSKAQIYLSHGNASEAFIESCGVASEGAIVVGSRVLTHSSNLDENNQKDLVIIRYRRFWNKYFAGAPSHFAGHARDAFEAIITVLSKVDLNKDIKEIRNNIRREIEKLSNYHGVTGSFTFSPKDHAGLGVDAFETYVIKDGNFIPNAE